MAILARTISFRMWLFPTDFVTRIPLASDGNLVTLGIRPTYPATGYGYIQRGATACPV
jgi:mannose-1-phosphate guanylyltransferase